MQELQQSFKFIKDNWPIVCALWNDHCNNTFSYCKKDVYESLINNNFKNISWCCFFASDFILDLYGVYDRTGHNKNLSPVESFDDLESGFIYKFGIMDHEFIIIYINDDNFYYVDYYMETERDHRFRFEKMNKCYFIKYVQSYINEDFDFHTQFHNASKSYQKEYIKQYYGIKNTHNLEIGGFIKLECARCQIKINPTINDIYRVIKNSLDESDIQFIEEEEDIDDVREWKETRNLIMIYLENLLKTYI